MSSPLRILCLENDLADAELLQDTLETEGIACKLTRVEAECDFRAAVQQGGFDLILADYTLPSFDGLSALRIVRQQLPDVPFIFVSGTLGEEVAIEALKMGATDYVFKTRLSRLVPAIHRATREAEEIAELRRSEEILREQANLLNLTHDTIFVMDMEGVIKYWNHGAEEQYGWAAEEALGKVVHDLLKTAFPIPLEEIKTDVIRKGRWEGELVHTKRDGRHVVVATRWSLQRDEQGTPIAILELNNDVTERKRAEEELREGETRFRTFVDHAGDAFFVLDQQQQGRVVDVNRQACESLGYTREELIGMALHDFDPDVDAAMLQGIRERIVAEGVCTFETRHRRKDGTTFPVEVRVRPLWHGGRPFHLALARDITERKRTEEALCRLNRELRAISNCNQTLLRATDEQSLLKEICRIVCEEAGYRLAWVGYAEHDDAKTVRPVAWAGVEDGYLATVNVSWADTERGQGPGGTAIRSGELVYFQDSTTDPRFAPWRESALQRGYRSGIVLPLKDEHANAFGCLCIYSAQSDAFTSEEIRLLEELAGDMAFGIVTLRSRDARKRAEEEVRNTAAQWQATFDAVQDLVLLLDKDFRILRANHAAAEFLGLPFDKIVGGHCYDLTHATSTPPAECPLAKMRQSRRHEEAEVLAGKGGPWLSVSVDPLFDPSGELTQVVHVARDITDRKRAEEERERLRQLEADLAHIDRVSILGELTASIAHEINQPLSGIVSSGSACLRWLARDVPDLEEAREAARRIVRDGKRAGEIIARIRALTKKAVASGEKLDLNETIREVLGLVSDEAKRRSVIIGTQFGDGVFPVRGDRVQLQQVLLNLVMNAIEAMSTVGDRARELVITTRNIDSDQVQVTVEDSGTGIDPQMIDKIFGSFYTTKPGGMGMGLSISRSILQAHGGRLWAAAKDGAGAIFHFTLPKYHEEESNAGV